VCAANEAGQSPWSKLEARVIHRDDLGSPILGNLLVEHLLKGFSSFILTRIMGPGKQTFFLGMMDQDRSFCIILFFCSTHHLQL
jgi:hypothetical protein